VSGLKRYEHYLREIVRDVTRAVHYFLLEYRVQIAENGMPCAISRQRIRDRNSVQS
jgi:hypothetical protein